MIEKMVPLELPPGIVKNGTMYQRANQWADGNLVRFTEGGPRAIAGASALTLNATPPGGVPCGAFSYSLSGDPKIIVGSSTKLWLLDYSFVYPSGAHEMVDLTSAMPVGSFSSAKTWWQFDRLNDTIIAVNSSGKVYSIDSTGTIAEITPDPFYFYTGVVVTDEQFVVLLRYGSGGTSIQWTSQGTLTFTPASTNSAGALDIRSSSPLIAGRVVNGQTMLLSADGLWRLNYVGAPLYYGALKVAGGCGIIGPNAVVVQGNDLLWMGHQGMYNWNGYTQPMPCPLADEIFDNVAAGKGHTVFAVPVGDDEIWWFWPFTGSATPNRVAVYNRKIGVWSRGEISRAAGVGAGSWPVSGSTTIVGARTVPVLIDAAGTTVYEHEQSGSVLSGAYLESGPMLLDPAGSSVVRVQKVAPDNNQTTAAENLTLYAGTWPKVAETSQVISIPAAGGEPLDARLSGRYIRYKQELTREDSRIGTPRLGVTIEGRR